MVLYVCYGKVKSEGKEVYRIVEYGSEEESPNVYYKKLYDMSSEELKNLTFIKGDNVVNVYLKNDDLYFTDPFETYFFIPFFNIMNHFVSSLGTSLAMMHLPIDISVMLRSKKDNFLYYDKNIVLDAEKNLLYVRVNLVCSTKGSNFSAIKEDVEQYEGDIKHFIVPVTFCYNIESNRFSIKIEGYDEDDNELDHPFNYRGADFGNWKECLEVFLEDARDTFAFGL